MWDVPRLLGSSFTSVILSERAEARRQAKSTTTVQPTSTQADTKYVSAGEIEQGKSKVSRAVFNEGDRQ
jgi:hypothetical protein